LADNQNKDIKKLQAEIAKLTEELQQKNLQLAESEKYVTLGQLTAGIAHEINTPLGALRSNNDLFMRCFAKTQKILFEDDSPESIRKNKELIKLFKSIDQLNKVNNNAVERIIDIVNSVRKYARQEENKHSLVNINELIDSTLPILQHELKHRIQVHRDFEDIENVLGYPHHLNQVFVNILVNAVQAIEGNGDIYIKTFQHKNDVVVEIRDTGKGISKENMKKIFKMGFTTKKIGAGMGLGLALVKQIIEAHHGAIEAESEVGKGTLFRIRLPISSGCETKK